MNTPFLPSVCVYLVGAGPGDPGLITVRGRKLIERADVLIVDHLANPKLLAYAPATARCIDVGKIGFSEHPTQDQINKLLISEAQELLRKISVKEISPYTGHTGTIVRLKGGDPFVFGRGGEEALALRAAGIPFEIVPGVTSGIAAPAYAGIPVTHRGVSSSVTFVTGNEDPTKVDSAVDWDGLASLVRRGDTVCFYMGMRNLPRIVESLETRGVAQDTPIALVQWGTTPRQRTLVATLATVVEEAQVAGIAAPVMIVVGPVVSLREHIAWLEHRPLQGKHIVVTRSRSQASVLTQRLEELGARVMEFPTIEFTPPTGGYRALDQAIGQLTSYDWVVFTSANGVEAFFERLGQSAHTIHDARALASARVAAIGPATAAALQAHGIIADAVPATYRAEAVFAAMQAANSGAGDARASGLKAGDRVLIPRAEVAREVLPDMLREAGCVVDVVPAYRTQAPTNTKAAGRLESLNQALVNHTIDAITFSSSSTARNLFALLGDDAAQLVENGGATACSIGPITTATLRELGIPQALIAQAQTYTIDGLIGCLYELFCKH